MSAFFSDIQRHFSLERSRISCSAFVGGAMGGVARSRGRYGTTTALDMSTSTNAESPITVTPEARGRPSRTTRTLARLPSIVSSATRPCCSAWINVRGPTARKPSGLTNGSDVSIGTTAPALPSAFTEMR